MRFSHPSFTPYLSHLGEPDSKLALHREVGQLLEPIAEDARMTAREDERRNRSVICRAQPKWPPNRLANLLAPWYTENSIAQWM